MWACFFVFIAMCKNCSQFWFRMDRNFLCFQILDKWAFGWWFFFLLLYFIGFLHVHIKNINYFHLLPINCALSEWEMNCIFYYLFIYFVSYFIWLQLHASLLIKDCDIDDSFFSVLLNYLKTDFIFLCYYHFIVDVI